MKAGRLRLLACCLFGVAAPAFGQAVVTSSGPDRVEVTVYRDPSRDPGQPFDLQMLNGYALVSETRRIAIPAGESEIRFEGVAGGIIPQSAIVAGFPQGIVERNRDAYLLSPATLIDAALGRRVALRRTSLATGAVTETEAVIRSGADGGVVVQTAAGVESLRCAGAAETLIHPAQPPGLSARPTLSVRARASQPVTATVRLAYLASGFDWQANYVATLSEDGGHVQLFAWLTLGSNDETSFVDASAQAVAGAANREPVEVQEPEGGPLQLRCWPAATTSDIPLEQFQRMAMGRGQALPGGGEEIVVTGSRMRLANLESNVPITSISADQIASRENLGDLKLYRIPMPVTVAANSQKQVAFLAQPRVQVRFAYRQDVSLYSGGVEQPTGFLLTRNRESEGLGEPLPGGRVILLGAGPDGSFLLGEASLADRAVGDEVELPFGPSPGLTSVLRTLERRRGRGRFELVVSNDRPSPAAFEGELHFDQVRADTRLERRNGRPLWRVSVPANGRAVLCFSASLAGDDRSNVPVQAPVSCGVRGGRVSAAPAAAGDSRPAPRR
ncbi:MAG TPA: hypothetical protein VMG08_05685 [Allosphingosinicella sp.]|nr:hypothetical protein [Allosphingosinicella sp.]